MCRQPFVDWWFAGWLNRQWMRIWVSASLLPRPTSWFLHVGETTELFLKRGDKKNGSAVDDWFSNRCMICWMIDSWMNANLNNCFIARPASWFLHVGETIELFLKRGDYKNASEVDDKFLKLKVSNLSFGFDHEFSIKVLKWKYL